MDTRYDTIPGLLYPPIDAMSELERRRWKGRPIICPRCHIGSGWRRKSRGGEAGQYVCTRRACGGFSALTGTPLEGTRLSFEQWRELLGAWAAGRSLAGMAEAAGCSMAAVKAALGRMPADMREKRSQDATSARDLSYHAVDDALDRLLRPAMPDWLRL